MCCGLNTVLSCDNLFVLLLLLQQTRLPREAHLSAVRLGTLAALLLRCPLVLFGAALLQRFGWLLSRRGEPSAPPGDGAPSASVDHLNPRGWPTRPRAPPQRSLEARRGLA